MSQKWAPPSSVNAAVDQVTQGGIIVPTLIPVTIDLFVTDVSKTIFVADNNYQVVSAKAVWGVVSASGTFMLEKLTSTTAPGSGTTLLTGTVDLTATVNTVVTPTLTSTTADLQLATGNRLGVKLAGVLTGLVGCHITVMLKRI